MPPIRPIVHSMEGVNAWGFVEVIRSGIVGIHIISILHLHQICDEICLQNSFQCGWVKVLPLCSLAKDRFFYFLETFILGPLLKLDCCHLLLTRHDTLSQNDVFSQNSIMRVIIEVSSCNQTHP